MDGDTITPGEVRLWWTSVEESAPFVGSLQALLDEEDLERAARFRVEAARRRFVTARAMLRLILSRFTGVAPEHLTFVFGEHGKPRLETDGPCFNLAHSGDTVVVAVAGDHVGVDIEELRVLPNADRLARRICTPQELETLLSLPEPSRNDALLRLWTAKEAVLKALGSGIAGGMRSVEVMVDTEGQPLLLRLHGEAAPWSLLPSPQPVSAVATVAVPRLSCHLLSRPFLWAEELPRGDRPPGIPRPRN